MKILLLCHRFPYPPDGGAKIRPFHMIRHLQKSHDVTVASLVRNDEEERAAPELAEFCERFHFERIGKWGARLRMVGNLFTRTPSSMGYFHSPALHRWVRAELERTPYACPKRWPRTSLRHTSSAAPANPWRAGSGESQSRKFQSPRASASWMLWWRPGARPREATLW